mgnify:CR=1 FL=1
MADLTKKEIKELLSEQTGVVLKAVDERLSEQTNVILNAVDEKLAALEVKFKKEIEENRRLIKDLTLTLDEFMRRVISQDEEIVLLRAKVDKISSFIKEKFGVEISAQ